MSRVTINASGHGGVERNIDSNKIVVGQSSPPWANPNTLLINYSTYNLDSTGLEVGIDPNYDNLTLETNNAGALTITGNGTSTASMFKTAGSSSWDTHVYSNVAYTAPCTIEFNKQASSGDNGASYAMIGWNTDPLTNASYDSLDYAAYPYRTDVYSVYHNSSQVHFSGTWNPASKFYITYATDGYIYHYNGTTLLYSVNRGTGATVYFDSAFYSVNGTYGGFSNVRISKRAYTAAGYAGGGGGGPIGLREPGTVVTTYNTNLPVTINALNHRLSIATNAQSFYGSTIDNRKTIVTNLNTLPYDAALVAKNDITISKTQVSTARTIDSNVSAGGGGVVTTLDKQVWY